MRRAGAAWRLLLALAAALLVACRGGPGRVAVERVAGGLEVRAEAPIVEAELRDADGVPLVRRRPPAPTPELTLDLPPDTRCACALTVRTAGGEATVPAEVAPLPPLELAVEAPVGQGRREVRGGEDLDLVLVDGRPAQVAAILTAWRRGTARLAVGEAEKRAPVQPGERLVLLATVDGPTPVRAALEAAGETVAVDARLAPRAVPAEAVRRTVAMGDLVFPADSGGAADPARAPWRVALPSGWWEAALRLAGRPARDAAIPWAHVGVPLDNTGDHDLNAVLRLRVLDETGEDDPAFRPRIRDERAHRGRAATALVRLPAGRAFTAALPLYVDPERLPPRRAAEGRWTVVVDLVPVGGAEPLLEARHPLYVSRGSPVVGGGFAVAVLGALLGSLFVAWRAPRWLREAPTGAVTTIAMFGALGFLVSALSRLLGMGVASLLGPFAMLVTGLVDDAARVVLLATLLTLLPRPGTATLAILVQWLLSGLALGELLPTDLLFVPNRVLWTELFLWVAGITRVAGWPDEAPRRRWLRLSVGLGGASLVGGALAFALHMVLFRLFFADWYIALLLAGPGFLYVVAACRLAVPFADSLRRVQR